MDSKEVENCTIFLTVAGSKAYGTDSPESDTDIRGVCILKDKSYYIGMGLHKFEQKDKGWEDPEDDKVIYDIRKAFSLMADGNPNMIDLLFTDERHWLKETWEWENVLEHREAFLSKKMRFTYGGYAYAQLKRIQRHRGYLMNPPKKKPERSDFGLPERKLISSDQAGAFQWLIAKMMEDSVQYMNLSDEAKESLQQINYIGLVQSNVPDECWGEIQKLTGATDQWIEAIMREKRYNHALQDWNAYQNWKRTRNPKRQKIENKFGYDTKHAMHLVRLMRMGMEILEKGVVQVYRHDREELKEIRNGAWSYEKVVEYAKQCDENLEKLYKISKLPKQPNRNFLDGLCQALIKGYVFK